MTPGRRDPRPTGFGPLSLLWWPVLATAWGLCAVPVVGPPLAGAVVATFGAAAGWVDGMPRAAPRRSLGARPAPERPHDARQPYRRLLGLAAALLPLSLAACPLLSGGFDTAAGGPPRTAAAEPPTLPTTTVDNPFWCPRRASP